MLSESQQFELDKYEVAYQHQDYRMGAQRKAYAQDNLRHSKQNCLTYLDVSCGHGEMLDYANSLGYEASGTEVVACLCERKDVSYGIAWNLPFADRSFDLVTFYDVIEHILLDDTMGTLEELNRVTGKELYITASNLPSKSKVDGTELHVNRLPYDEWDKIFKTVFVQDKVSWLPRKYRSPGETWHIIKKH